MPAKKKPTPLSASDKKLLEAAIKNKASTKQAKVALKSVLKQLTTQVASTKKAVKKVKTISRKITTQCSTAGRMVQKGGNSHGGGAYLATTCKKNAHAKPTKKKKVGAITKLNKQMAALIKKQKAARNS